MKLCRYGAPGSERPGLVDVDGNIRDLSSIVPDIDAQTLRPESLAALAALDPMSLPLVPGPQRYGVPVSDIRKYIAIGLNYADHAKEAGLAPPPEPIFFTKAISCLSGPNDPVMLPAGSIKTDWEVELGVIIGTTCRYVDQARALDHVAGYVLANDVSERAFQKELGSQWDKGKGCDTFGPVGPWLVTRDEIVDPQQLAMTLHLNGRRMQHGNTATMIFPVAECIAYVSRFITLNPGDLLITGTPPGVGEGQKPHPIYLKPGDVMELAIDGLGEQRQAVIEYDPGYAATL